MHAENLGNHDDDRQILLAFGLRAVGVHVVAVDVDLDFAGGKARGVGVNDLRGDRHHGGGETGAQRNLEEIAAIAVVEQGGFRDHGIYFVF